MQISRKQQTMTSKKEINKVFFNQVEYCVHPKLKSFAASKIGQILDIKKETIILRDRFEDGCWNFKSMRSCDFIYECWNGSIPKNKNVTNINNIKIDNRISNIKLV